MNTRLTLNKWLVLIAPSMLIIFAIWLPFGFSMTGLIEEWGVLATYMDNGLYFLVTPSSPLAAHSLRPLTVFPHSLAYFLDSDSFNYWHVLLITILILKGMMTSTLLWQTTGSLRWAMIAALLVIVYPADTMQLSFRGIHINLALTLLLLASSLFIAAIKNPKPMYSYAFGLCSGLALWAAMAMYEATVMLVLLPFFLLYVSDGFKGCLKLCYAKKGLVFIWFLSLILYLAYVAYASSIIKQSYQKALVGDNLLHILQHQWWSLFNPGLIRSLFGGWFDAWRILLKEISYLGYLYIFTAILFFCVFLYKTNSSKKQTINLLARLALVGILLSLLGFSPYILSASHLVISQRTYLFASIGAMFFWLALMMMIAEWKAFPAFFLAILLLIPGLGFQLFQFHHYVQISQNQTFLLRNLIANFDGKVGKKTLLILDGSNQLLHTWMFVTLSPIFQYFYGHKINDIEVCKIPGNEWRSMTQFAGQSGNCIENEKEWILQAPKPLSGPGLASSAVFPDKIIAKENALVLTINPDGTVSENPKLASYRQNLQQSESHEAKRYRNILSSSPWAEKFKGLWVAPTKERYQWSFGNWWSMELPIAGSGWREAEWIVGKLYHYALAWKNKEDGILGFNLEPVKKAYTLRGKFGIIVNDKIRKSIELRINQQSIPYKLETEGQFEAQIPPNLLVSGTNFLNIHSLIDPNYYGLSLQMAWFEIVPT